MFVKSKERRHLVGRFPVRRSLEVQNTCFLHSARMVKAMKQLPPCTPTPKLLEVRHSLAKSMLSILAMIAARQRRMPVPAPMGR
eukprot:12009806-Ditylum_brightwellii.AAC.1